MLNEAEVGHLNKPLIGGNSSRQNEQNITFSVGKWILGIWLLLLLFIATLLARPVSCFPWCMSSPSAQAVSSLTLCALW